MTCEDKQQNNLQNMIHFHPAQRDLIVKLCDEHICQVMCLQETHKGPNNNRPNIPGMKMAIEKPHEKYEVPSMWNLTWPSAQHQWLRTTTLRYLPSTWAVSLSLLSTNYQIDSFSWIAQTLWTITRQIWSLATSTAITPPGDIAAQMRMVI